MEDTQQFIEADEDSLSAKVDYLKQPSLYPNTSTVQVVETHMSWVFMSADLVYKLKKPVQCYFLDFTKLESRMKFCFEEFRINQPLGGDIYLGVVPLVKKDGRYLLDGDGEVVDWLVKMRRLPAAQMLDSAIRDGSVDNKQVQHAAELLVNFYMSSAPVNIDPKEYRQRMIDDMNWMCSQLSIKEFRLSQGPVVGIETDLVRYVIKHGHIFDRRLAAGRIIDAHGDLRPEHIYLSEKPAIIDRIEFNKKYRIMDVAEELSYLALECELMSAPSTGQLFLNIYKWKSHDRIPESLTAFYKAKRAILKAMLSILHLKEQQFMHEEEKWRSLCNRYLQAAKFYCDILPDK